MDFETEDILMAELYHENELAEQYYQQLMDNIDQCVGEE